MLFETGLRYYLTAFRPARKLLGCDVILAPTSGVALPSHIICVSTSGSRPL